MQILGFILHLRKIVSIEYLKKKTVFTGETVNTVAYLFIVKSYFTKDSSLNDIRNATFL